VSRRGNTPRSDPSRATLLTGVRRLPLTEARILSEEHKAVLLVVMGTAKKEGSPGQG
jgi:hypothetical protein